MQEGVVTHRVMPPSEEAQREVRRATCHEPHIKHRQLMAYHLCLYHHGHRHQWMGAHAARPPDSAGALCCSWLALYACPRGLTFLLCPTLLPAAQPSSTWMSSS
jgi:hypothetical protein